MMAQETFDLERLGRILAINARILGMQALNMQRAAVGSSMAYDDADFFCEADKIDAVVAEKEAG